LCCRSSFAFRHVGGRTRDRSSRSCSARMACRRTSDSLRPCLCKVAALAASAGLSLTLISLEGTVRTDYLYKLIASISGWALSPAAEVARRQRRGAGDGGERDGAQWRGERNRGRRRRGRRDLPEAQ